MPDYRITIYMKIGKPKKGVRWHPSYDLFHVRPLVEKKVYEAFGIAAVKDIVVEIIRGTGSKVSDSKPLIQLED